MEGLIDQGVQRILWSIVVGNGASEAFRESFEGIDCLMTEFVSGSAAQLADDGEAGFSLVEDEENRGGLAIARGVGLPMPGHAPGGDRAGALGDWNAVRDVLLEMFAFNVTAISAFAVGLGEKTSKPGSVGIDPLVNGFVADAFAGKLERQAARNEFRGPAQAEFGLDIAADERITQTRVPRSRTPARIGAGLSRMRAVVACVDGSAIAAQFTGEGRRIAAQLSSNEAQRLPLGAEERQLIPLDRREVRVAMFGVHKHPRYRTSGVALHC